MRSVRYSVAMSLDGYIAGPQGEAEFGNRDGSKCGCGGVLQGSSTPSLMRPSWAGAPTSVFGEGASEGMSDITCSPERSPAAGPRNGG